MMKTAIPTTKCKANQTLDNWVHKQRTHYKVFCDGGNKKAMSNDTGKNRHVAHYRFYVSDSQGCLFL